MRLSRIAIAAIFIAVGAFILIPMLTNSSSSSPSGSGSPTPSTSTVSPSESPSPTTRSPGASPSGTPPSGTPRTPLKVKVARVRCPGRTVQVTVANGGQRTEDYAITTDGSIAVADRIPAGATRKSTVNVQEDHTTSIAVTWHNVPVQSTDRSANCAGHHAKALPHTGVDSGLVYARVATGIAALLTGAVIFWYGRLWPRRRSKMFD